MIAIISFSPAPALTFRGTTAGKDAAGRPRAPLPHQVPGRQRLFNRPDYQRKNMTHRAVRRSLAFFAFVSGTAFAQAPDNPYAGQEQRNIKALSAKEAADYLNGRGMGTSKAAELNQYPGPRHVLDNAAKLGLSHDQIAKATEIAQAMEREAVRLGREIVHKEAELDAQFAQRRASPESIREIVSALAQLQAQFRLAHLNAHLGMRPLLSAEQAALYDRVRGYGGAASPGSH
jgi:hypothetical protein